MSEKIVFEGIKFDNDKEVSAFKAFMHAIEVAANDKNISENKTVDDFDTELDNEYFEYNLDIHMSAVDTTNQFQQSLDDLSYGDNFDNDDFEQELSFG